MARDYEKKFRFHIEIDGLEVAQVDSFESTSKLEYVPVLDARPMVHKDAEPITFSCTSESNSDLWEWTRAVFAEGERAARLNPYVHRLTWRPDRDGGLTLLWSSAWPNSAELSITNAGEYVEGDFSTWGVMKQTVDDDGISVWLDPYHQAQPCDGCAPEYSCFDGQSDCHKRP